MTISRSLQWIGATLVLLVLVGLNYDFDSEAGMRMNASLDDPLSQGLRGYWKLDEGTGTSTTADASGNANTLSMTGPPTWTTGTIGPYAMDFSGSGQYLSVADPASGVLDFVDGADFTLTGWFNRDLFAADHTIVAKKTDQTTNAGYVIWIDNSGGTDYLNFEISDGTDTYSVASATDFSATGWHNFAAVWDDSNGMYLYIDGGLNGSTTTSTSSIGSLANANAFRIGAESDAGVPFDGKLDDIRVYGSVLSADEVAKLYQTTAPTQPVDTGLVGHWTFDGPDIQGTTAIDRSSFGNNGTMTGTTKTIGKLGQGLNFNGTSQYVNITGLSLPDWQSVSGYTISLWVKNFPDNLQGRVIFEMWNSGDNNKRIHLSSNNYVPYQRLEVVTGREYSSREGYISGYEYASVNDTLEWHHLAIEANSAELTLFYNGSEVDSDTTISTYGSFTFDSMRIGGGASDYNGNASVSYAEALVDDVRIYNRKLSIIEILNLYNQGK